MTLCTEWISMRQRELSGTIRYDWCVVPGARSSAVSREHATVVELDQVDRRHLPVALDCQQVPFQDGPDGTADVADEDLGLLTSRSSTEHLSVVSHRKSSLLQTPPWSILRRSS